jgi:nucleotide-binding universal stress UspA family protein
MLVWLCGNITLRRDSAVQIVPQIVGGEIVMTIMCGLTLQGDESALLAIACGLAQTVSKPNQHDVRVFCSVAATDKLDPALQVALDRWKQLRADAELKFGALMSVEIDVSITVGDLAHRLLLAFGADEIKVEDTSKAQLNYEGLSWSMPHGAVNVRDMFMVVVAAGSIGPAANQLLAVATVPVLLLRDAANWNWIAALANKNRLRVVIGIDDSHACDLALAWLKNVGRGLPLQANLVRVYNCDEASVIYGATSAEMSEHVPDLQRMMARDALRRWDANPGEAGYVVPQAIEGSGRIGEDLLRITDSHLADLVVVGTSRQTFPGVIGAVSAVVVAGANSAVLCIPPTTAVIVQRPPVRCVVVATDDSTFSNRAIPYAVALCSHKYEAEIHIVHVRKVDGIHVDIESRKDGRAPVWQTHVLYSDNTALSIVQCAARVGADLICMASLSQAGDVLGSVPAHVLRLSTRPVVIVSC